MAGTITIIIEGIGHGRRCPYGLAGHPFHRARLDPALEIRKIAPK